MATHNSTSITLGCHSFTQQLSEAGLRSHQVKAKNVKYVLMLIQRNLFRLDGMVSAWKHPPCNNISVINTTFKMCFERIPNNHVLPLQCMNVFIYQANDFQNTMVWWKGCGRKLKYQSSKLFWLFLKHKQKFHSCDMVTSGPVSFCHLQVRLACHLQNVWW